MTLAADLKRMGFKPDQIATATCNGKPLACIEGPDRVTVTHSTGLVRIVALGPVMGKPRMTQRDKWKKRECVVRYRNWCDRVRAAVGDSLPAAESVTRLDWTACFRPPKSWSKKKHLAAIGTLHRNKPDRDNIDKAVLDCLFAQDSGIACGDIRKVWGWNDGIEITIQYTEGNHNG